MKFIKWIVLIGLFTCAQAQPASFDCAKARSTIERMICNNAGLSDMDAQLGEAYKTAKERLSDSESKQLSSEQRDWLQNVRNRCSDGDCLLKAYETRLNAVDPFADKKITCEEMKKLPGLVFSGGIDLGSGSGSPVEVDYDCAESLKKQAYMQTLLGLAEQIHGDGGPQVCTGSIVHAIWRYYHFSLAEAGFSPRTLLLNKKSTRAGGNWDSLSEKSGSDEEGRVFLYFKQWSEKSLINLRLYADFTAEFDRVLPQLVKHYEQKFKLQKPEAQLAASRALMLVVHRAAGSFPQRELKPDHVLVQLLRDGKTSQNDILRALDDRTGNGPNGSDIYQALVVALLHDRPFQIVNLLAEKISPDLIRSANERDEPLLSFAIRNQKNLEYLLSKNVEVNAQNEFGKTALFYAIGSGNHQAVATLLKHGADVNHAYKSGTELRPDGNECTYPGLSHTKRTPLMHAAQNSDVQMLKILLRAGANIGAVDDVGYNAMDYAAMGKNKENESHLRSWGMEFASPIYTSDADSSVRERSINETVAIDGYVKKLQMAPARPDLLLAAVTPWDTLIPNNKHGLYLISIADPDHPRVTSVFGRMNPADFALSPDGQRAYLMEMAYNGAPDGKKFGLTIIDLKNPENPRLIEQIEGDFMTMHLSPDGKTLYLQERSLKKEFSRGLLVYSLGENHAEMKCSDPFGKVDYFGAVFAYSFASFPDEALLLIGDRSSRAILFDVRKSCSPKKLAEFRTELVSGPVVGLGGRTLVTGSGGGLSKFRIADSLLRIATYQAAVGSFYVNLASGFSAAVIDKDVAIFRSKPSGQFVLSDRFRLATNAIGGIMQTDSGRVYVGWKGGLGVGVIPRN